MRFRTLSQAALASLLCACASLLSSSAHEFECAGSLRGTGAPVDSAEFRKYAPERSVDILHIAIDVTPDFRERSIAATTTIRFQPIGPVTEVRLNAQDLRIQKVTSKEAKVAAHHSTDSELVVLFAEPLPAGKEQELTVVYTAFPSKGLYFRTKEMGYKATDEHLFTQGEDIEARHWFPCFDAPNEKFTSEIICHVPAEMTVLSNGSLVSEKPGANGMKAVHWSQEKPHVSYLISLVAGNFKKVEDRYKEIPLAFYTPASQIGLADDAFEDTKDMMAFFEEEIGMAYPWSKYYQVCVHDFMWGGMENTSISTLADHRTLYPKEIENIRSSQGLIAHELAHQWFGDLVTCKDWSQIWLNEGFATYYSHLYRRHKDGTDDFLYGLYNSAGGFIHRTVAEDSRPIVFRRYDQPTELFGYLVYPKGAWVLHMLRHELGEELFRKCVKTYLERHQFDTVVTHDLISVVEELSGRPFDRFFDQWVFHPHHPELQVKYSWDQQQKLARVRIAQVQPLTNEVALFHFPLKLRFKGKFGTVDRVIQVQDKETDLFVPLDAAPEIVRVDPDLALLAKVTIDLPRALWVAQLKDETDVIGRVLAAVQLGKSRDTETVDLLAERLRKDPFYGVRLESAEALRRIHSEEALQALIDSAEQKDARVRNKVATEIGAFFNEKAAAFAHRTLEKEKNPEILQTAARSLGAYPGESHQEALLTALKSDSHEEILAEGAVSGLRARREEAAIEPLIAELENPANSFNSRGITNILLTIGTIAHDLENKDRAYQLLLGYASDLRQTVRLGAIRALALLEDDRALAALSNIGSGPSEAAETIAANRAIEQIRTARPAGTDLQALRSEVLELKKQNDGLKKSFEELKKQIEAREARPSAPTKRPTTPAGRRR